MTTIEAAVRDALTVLEEEGKFCVTDAKVILRRVLDGGCPAHNHLPIDNTKVVTVADCGWCGQPVIVR